MIPTAPRSKTVASSYKLHSFVVRLSHNHKEVFIAAASEEEARIIFEKLMPASQKFDAKMGGWAYLDIRKAPKP